MKRIFFARKKMLSAVISRLSIQIVTGLVSISAASVSVAAPVTIVNDGMTHVVDNNTPGSAYNIENGSTLDVQNGGVAGDSSEQSNVTGHSRVNVSSGGLLTGYWTVGSGSVMYVSGATTAARSTGAASLFGEAFLDNAFVDVSGTSHLIAFLIENGTLNTTAATVIRSADTAIEAEIDHTASRININGSQISAGRYGIYLNGTGTNLVLDKAVVTGGTSALYVKDLNNIIQVHGGELKSTGAEPLSSLSPSITSAGIVFNLRPGGNIATGRQAAFSVDSGTRIEGLTSEGAGIFIKNDGSTPVFGSIADSTVLGGKYGIYTISSQASPPSQGMTSLTLNNSSVSSSESAIRVDNGTTLSVILENGSQLAGDNGSLVSVGNSGLLNLSVNDSTLTGNLLNNEGGTANVTLGQNGRLNGTMQSINSVSVENRALWQLTGNSIVDNLSNNGTVSLATENTAGNELTVNGNYTGNGGALLFNSVLAGDSSPTDKLVVKGNASGTTNVTVTNAGGTGAKTIDGVKIIEVDGASAAGAFKQQGRIVAGAYDYTLNERGNSWYLDSRFSPVVPPVPPIPPIPPVPPIPVVHVIRPEAGSYMANQVASSMFLTTLHDRAGENRYMNALSADGSVSSLWLRQVGNHNQFRDGSGQLRTTGNTYVAQLGGDLTQWSSNDLDRFRLGIMAGSGNNHNNTHSAVSGHGSKGSVDGYSVGMYSTWYQNDQANTGAYVDGQILYSWFNNHVDGDGINEEKYKSKGLTASLESGYTFALGESGPQDNPTAYFIEPQAQVIWMGVKSDDVTEANGTKVSAEGDNNVQTRLGARAFLQGHNQMDNGKVRNFQPFAEVNWLHNTKRNGVVMNGVSLEQAGATNVGEVKLGVEGQLSRQVALWGNVGQQLGDKGYSNTAAMVSIKYSF